MAEAFFTRVQLFLPASGGYSEERSLSTFVRVGQWQRVEFRIPVNQPAGRLRIDPADAPGLLELSELTLHPTGSTGVPRSRRISADALLFAGTAVRLRAKDGTLTVFSYGHDPQILLPEVSGWPAGGSMHVLIRARTGETVLAEFLRSVVNTVVSSSASELSRTLLQTAMTNPEAAARMIDDLDSAREELRRYRIELEKVRKDLNRKIDELETLRAELGILPARRR